MIGTSLETSYQPWIQECFRSCRPLSKCEYSTRSLSQHTIISEYDNIYYFSWCDLFFEGFLTVFYSDCGETQIRNDRLTCKYFNLDIFIRLLFGANKKKTYLNVHKSDDKPVSHLFQIWTNICLLFLCSTASSCIKQSTDLRVTIINL